MNPRYNHDKIIGEFRQSYLKLVSSIFHVEDTFLFSGIVFSAQKDPPAHHISVKDRGLFNSVWGDGTTFSFYQVIVPSQIFNHPPGCCSGTLPLYSGTHHFSLSAVSGFLFVITPPSISPRDITRDHTIHTAPLFHQIIHRHKHLFTTHRQITIDQIPNNG